MSNNYFKLITDGRIERIEHFDDTRSESVTAAYIRITRGRHVDPRDKHRVVVWSQAPAVPGHIPQVGDWYCPKCQKPPELHTPGVKCAG